MKNFSPIAAENIDSKDFELFVKDFELLLSGFKQKELYTLMGTDKSYLSKRKSGAEPVTKTFLAIFYERLERYIDGRRAGKSAYEIKAELAIEASNKANIVEDPPHDPSLLDIWRLLKSIQASNGRIEQAIKTEQKGRESSEESIP
jgi:hypothetical protein